MKKLIILSLNILWISMATAQKVGINTPAPDSTLTVAGSTHLSGNTLIDGNLQLPTGAGAGKLLQSDASGNTSWAAPAAGMPAGTNPGQMLYWNGSAWISVTPGTQGQTLNYCDGVPTWGICLPRVTICTQVWSTKNLDVSTYRNGDAIPQVTDNTTWTNLTTGAYCYYNNDSATYAATYGKLYNWYAVNDPRGLAPNGWHIATDAEWITLTTCLGGESVAGGPMKEVGTTHWASPNQGATNSSGFTGLPGGFRNAIGTFLDVGNFGYWWSSTESATANAWSRYLFYNLGSLNRLNINKHSGFSVRCLRD